MLHSTPALPRLRLWLAAALAGSLVLMAQTVGWRDGISLWWQGRTTRLEILVHGGWWWGTFALAVSLGLLLLTAGWWGRRWPAVCPATRSAAPRWLLPVVLVLMATGAALRAPRLGLSLYNDECHVFRSHLAGRIPMAHLGNPDKFRPVTWLATLYENRAANNSMPFSVLARASYDSWRTRTGASPGTVNETALRLPVLVCGVLSIGAMAWLAFRLGGPRVAVLAAVLTAIHPWHLRYSVEARSYGILMLMLPLMFLALDSALRSGRWRHWLLFGILQYLVLATWFGSAHLLAALHLTLAAAALLPFLRTRRLAELRWNLLLPAVVSGLTALTLYLLINLPHYVQLARALADPAFFKSPHPFSVAWFQDTAAFQLFGMPAFAVHKESLDAPQPALALLRHTAWIIPLLFAAVVWMTGLAAGSARVFRHSLTGTALFGATFGGALLTWAYCTAKGIVFLKWYSLFLLPGLLILLALGLARLCRHRHPVWLALAALPLLFAWAPVIPYYQTHSRENLRRAVEIARDSPYPLSLTNPSGTLYGVTWSESPIYDPAAVTLRDAAALDSLIIQARKESRPLTVAYGQANQAVATAPDLIAKLHDPALFDALPPLRGMDEASNDHFLFRLRPDSPVIP